MKSCWFYQKAASWAADSPAPVPRWLERHLAVCPECRRFHRDQTQLVSALSATASGHVTEAPPFLRTRVISALRSESSQPARSALAMRWIRAMLIPALGVVLFMAYFVRKPESPNQPPPVSVSPAASLAEVVGQWFPQADPSQLLAWTERVDQPLETELDSVVSDAKLAFESLANNFLPDHEAPRER